MRFGVRILSYDYPTVRCGAVLSKAGKIITARRGSVIISAPNREPHCTVRKKYHTVKSLQNNSEGAPETKSISLFCCSGFMLFYSKKQVTPEQQQAAWSQSITTSVPGTTIKYSEYYTAVLLYYTAVLYSLIKSDTAAATGSSNGSAAQQRQRSSAAAT